MKLGFDEWLASHETSAVSATRPVAIGRLRLILWPGILWVGIVAIFGLYVIGLFLIWPAMTLALLLHSRRPVWLILLARAWVGLIVRVFAFVAIPGMPLRQLGPRSGAVITVQFIEEPARRVPKRMIAMVLAQLLPTFVWTVAKALFAWPGLILDVLRHGSWGDRWWLYALWNVESEAYATAYSYQVLPRGTHPEVVQGHWPSAEQ